MRSIGAALAIALFTFPAHSGNDHQPYAGLEDRDVTSLSRTDIEELQRGGGWGLALPAELNGYPGPAHVLELREKLGLSPGQVEAFEALYDEMNAEAVAVGAKLIEAENALDNGFEKGGLTPDELRQRIHAAEQHRADLRFIHLSRHLQSVDILSSRQVEQYNVLRGYADDPCSNVPEGHNPAMWRKHNGCAAE